MCLVCVEWQSGKLTSKEALRNLGELIQTKNEDGQPSDHYYAVVETILDKEVPNQITDEDMDAAWHRETHKDSSED